jgi:hypothetical protein
MENLMQRRNFIRVVGGAAAGIATAGLSAGLYDPQLDAPTRAPR